MKLAGKVALVTGAARGIGLSIATRLASEGAAVALVDIDRVAAEAAARRLAETGATVLGFGADVSKRAQVCSAIDVTAAALGGIDIMVNNAGIVQVQPFSKVTEDELDRIVAINLKGTFWGIQVAADRMIAQGRGGKIINASSIAGHDGYAMFAAYSATKFAVRALTQVASREYGRHGITVNAYCPGNVGTDMLQSIDDRYVELGLAQPGETLSALHAVSSLTRSQTPDDVAGLVCFLAGPDADYITGQGILVDGGGVVR